jgi:hypothetical protein
MEWGKSNLKKGPNDDSFGTLGPRYWQSFCRRNADVITSKKAVRFDSKRDDQCRIDNFTDMYDGVYNKSVDAGVTEVLEHEVCQRDIHNNVVQTEAEAYGRKTRYPLLHPDKLLFFDEVGENISHKGDGNAGGQKFMAVGDTRAQVRNSFKYNHFTVLGFTAADGCAVMCAIIIAASKLKVIDVTGFNPLSKDAEDMSSDEMKVLEAEIEKIKR